MLPRSSSGNSEHQFQLYRRREKETSDFAVEPPVDTTAIRVRVTSVYNSNNNGFADINVYGCPSPLYKELIR